MTQSLCVAGMQMHVTPDIPRNMLTLCRAIEQARDAGADILLTPEGSLSGYSHEFDAAQVKTALDKVLDTARHMRIALALGTCYEEADGLTYNQIRFYDCDGTFQGFHSKILRCGTMTDPTEGEINHFATSALRTFCVRGVVVGGLICNDMWANPACTPMGDSHLTHLLARQGAQVILHAVNGGRDGSDWARDVIWSYHETNLRMRARVDRLWIATVDNSYPPDVPCSAPSGVINPDGQWVCRAKPQGEQLFVHHFDMPTVSE